MSAVLTRRKNKVILTGAGGIERTLIHALTFTGPGSRRGSVSLIGRFSGGTDPDLTLFAWVLGMILRPLRSFWQLVSLGA